jgi:hypothetical protein
MAALNRARFLRNEERVPARSRARTSHDETSTPHVRMRSPETAMPVVIRIRYRYPVATARGQNSENCWMICGNLAPSDFRLFCNILSSKGLYLLRSGMLLANRVAPALVRMYWCPKP